MTNRDSASNRNARPADDDLTNSIRSGLNRRTIIGVGGSLATIALAGCMGGTNGSVGTFRLLVSDMPADIGDFDSLDVSFETARIFRGEADAESDGSANESDEPGDGEPDESGEATNESEDAEEENGDTRDWYELALDGATVDLTQVVGDKAMGVFEGELDVGRYEKIELHVAEVVGIVNGEEVDVKVPSEKLQIVTPFEIRADEAVSFVFDINVVKKGPNGGYNLLPVISESGVVGEDVEVEEIDRDEEGSDGPDRNATTEERGPDAPSGDEPVNAGSPEA